jgi:hypothetical protein
MPGMLDLAFTAAATKDIGPATSPAPCLESISTMYPPEQPDRRVGLFGPVVAVPTDAPLVDQVVGLSGRDPGWTARL